MGVSIKAEDISKVYHLGQVGTGTLSRDIERWWALMRGKEDPFLKLGEKNDRTQKGDSNIVYSLQDINFEINQGDAVGIIGKNGAGKSTLLKILSRITSPTSGKIQLNGRVASLLEVGTGFHPELTGRENIYLNGTILGMRKKEISRKLDEIIAFSGVERYVDTPVKRYSSGMYVRLAFAVAAHLDSEILIVDEVLAVGDAEFQNKCLGKMNEVAKGEGRTVLFVSHNLGAVKRLCDKSIVLKNGLMHFQGEVNEGVQRYLKSTVESQKDVDLTHVFNNEDFDRSIVWQSVSIEQNGVETREVNNHEEFVVNVKYKVKENLTGFRIFIGLENSQEQVIFKSFFDENMHWGTNIEAGEYSSQAILPKDIFMEGQYVLKAYATIHDVRNIPPYDGVKLPFDVYQTGYINRNSQPASFSGVITLPIKWQTETLQG